MFPRPPQINSDIIQQCESSEDYRPIFFEYCKYVGLLSNFLASVRQESKLVKIEDRLTFIILKVLLNRISKLILANVTLSNEGLNGEATSIIDRCIFESAVNGIWISHNNSDAKNSVSF